MTKWTDFFTIELANPGSSFWDDNKEFVVKDADGNIVGRYRDRLYAKKQAKYKFKKMQAKIEKLLLK